MHVSAPLHPCCIIYVVNYFRVEVNIFIGIKPNGARLQLSLFDSFTRQYLLSLQ